MFEMVKNKTSVSSFVVKTQSKKSYVTHKKSMFDSAQRIFTLKFFTQGNYNKYTK